VRAQGVTEVIVVDGGSRDATVARAREAGARIVVEQRCGYGRAMLAGIALGLA
jgi:glycosyltransferase involved in cell wall biosynthesis